MKRVPSLLVALRLLLGPALFLAAHNAKHPKWTAIILLSATLSDIFDGVIARKLGVATEKLRVADSRADFCFYMFVCAAVWANASDIVLHFKIPLLILLCLDGASYVFDLIKYKRIATLHAYSAKIWGLSLFFTAFALLVFHVGGPWMWASIVLGIISNLDGLAIKLILPNWQHDVLSCLHAYKSQRSKLPAD
jgi:phosphatidylglycerophosphate synthase